MSSTNGILVGPGSQPEDPDAQLEYMEMPKGMTTYSMPAIPEPEEIENLDAAMAILDDVHGVLESQESKAASGVFDVTGLDAANRDLVDQVLGEGEVSIIGGGSVQAQESVLTGVWRVRYSDADGQLERDTIEVGLFPASIAAMANAAVAERVPDNLPELPEGVLNAPPLLAELQDKLEGWTPSAEPHVINLTLLPQTDEDLAYLDERLGRGQVTILSRGYGNCRITSTGVRNVWWVQYYNSNEGLILNTLEVSDIPDVACAAPEDIEASAQRLGEILEVYR